jgi:hypothetical protein
MKNTLILWFYQKDPLNSERYKNKNFTKSEDVTRATLMTPTNEATSDLKELSKLTSHKKHP